MGFDIYETGGAKIAEDVSEWGLYELHKQGLIKDTDKIVERTAIAKDIQKMKDRNTISKRGSYTSHISKSDFDSFKW